MKRNVERMWNMTIATLAGLTLGAGLAPNAKAGCGDIARNVYALNAPGVSPMMAAPRGPMTAFEASADQPQPEGASIVGMWRFTFVAKDSPPVPNGTVVDAGFSQWHSDGTEITNSSKPPATGNFCLGVWKKTGPASYKLNHKALDFKSDGTLIGEVAIHEDVTVDRSGNRFSGSFSIESFDLAGNLIGRVAGEVTAQRITVD